MELKALSTLTNKGLLPAEPQIGADGNPYLILFVERTYGPAPDGRVYFAAIIGREDEAGFQHWTATGSAPNTPNDATWAEIMVWLTTPKKSKWLIKAAEAYQKLADSKPLNHELYRSGK